MIVRDVIYLFFLRCFENFETFLNGCSSFSPTLQPPFQFITMLVIDSIDDLAQQAAAGDDIQRYLRQRGIRTVAALALVATDEEALNRHIIDPLFSGWTHQGSTITISRGEQPIAKAILLHMWNLAKVTWNKHLAHHQNMATPTPTATPPSSTCTTTTDQKAPKSLPPGVWSGLLRAYNTVQLGGEDREFPVVQVLGAEATIARMYWEKNTSALYPPVQLGEIVQRRSFTAGGDINPLARSPKKGTTLELTDDNTIITSDEVTWSPRSLLAIMDGFDSIRWAMVLVKWGEEKPIHELFDWLNQRARSRPNKTEQLASFWQSVSWTIAMMLRNGQTFREITTTITKDLDKFNDYMARESTVKIKPNTNDSKGLGKTGKSKSQKGEKGMQWRSQPYFRDRNHQQSDNYWNARQTWNRSNTYQQSSSSNRWQYDSHSWQGDRYQK